MLTRLHHSCPRRISQSDVDADPFLCWISFGHNIEGTQMLVVSEPGSVLTRTDDVAKSFEKLLNRVEYQSHTAADGNIQRSQRGDAEICFDFRIRS